MYLGLQGCFRLLNARYRMRLGTVTRHLRSSLEIQIHKLKKRSAGYLVRLVRSERQTAICDLWKVVRHTESPVHIRFSSARIVELAVQLAGDAFLETFPY